MKGEFNFTVDKGNKVFWGILFLLGAAAFLVSRLGLLEGVGFWSILFSIGLVAILIKNLARRSWGGILFSLAFLVIVNDELLKLEAITPWPVLGAALLGTIGLNLLFPKVHRAKSYKLIAGGEHTAGDYVSGDRASYENTFGSTVKYVTGEVSRIHLDNAFGGMEVYFSDAVLKDHRANIKIDSAFGRVVLYVPESWQVISEHMETAFGDMVMEHENPPEAADTLYVSGDISFGALVITTV